MYPNRDPFYEQFSIPNSNSMGGPFTLVAIQFMALKYSYAQ